MPLQKKIIVFLAIMILLNIGLVALYFNFPVLYCDITEKYLSNYHEMELCYSKAAILINNFSICSKCSDAELCYSYITDSLKDPAECDKFPNVNYTLFSRNVKDFCYLQFATLKLHDPELCKKVIQNDKYATLRDDCFEMMALEKHDKKWCNEIVNSFRKEACEVMS